MSCSCQKKRKISGIMKGKNLSNIMMGVAGFVAANYLDRVGFIGENPKIGAIAKLGLGMYLSGKRGGGMMSQMGTGIAINGAKQLIGDVVPGLGISGVNYLPASYSNAVHSVAGAGYYPNSSGPIVVD